MLGLILNKLTGRITVDVSPDAFVFLKGNRMVTLATHLYLYRDEGRWHILGIGEEFEGSEGCIKVGLFSGDTEGLSGSFRTEILESFLRFGFARVLGRKFGLPTVAFRGAYNLDKLFDGAPERILGYAAEKAGAYSVEFID